MTLVKNRSSIVYSKALGKRLEVGRVIGRLGDADKGPTVVFFGGIHGNEPSGVFALNQVMRELKPLEDELQGAFIGLSGNLWALQEGRRFHRHDLNRLWIPPRMERLEKGDPPPTPESRDLLEQEELFNFIRDLLENQSPPFYFLDLHTTSSDSIPFLTVNDTLVNRDFATRFPVPIILGIEEYLNGPLLNYINELGYIAVGFEAGQHDDPASVANHRAFIYLALAHAGLLPPERIPEFNLHNRQLREAAGDSRCIYEIRYRHEVLQEDQFNMKPGYQNFQPVHKGENLARSNEEEVDSPETGLIFMPLYQDQGDDGFFIIRRVPRLALRLSAWLRKRKIARLLEWLPGVNRHPLEKNALIVDKRIARFFARDFFHLFGFRSKQIDHDHIIMRDRETASRYFEY